MGFGWVNRRLRLWPSRAIADAGADISGVGTRSRKMALIPFDDRDGLIWLNGEMVDWRDAKTHTFSHGLHYASLVFEGERAYGGHHFCWRGTYRTSARFLPDA